MFLYHAIENTANQNTGKPFPLNTPGVCCIHCVGHCKIEVTREIFHGIAV